MTRSFCCDAPRTSTHAIASVNACAWRRWCSKKGTLIGTFIADQKHPFFEGESFTAVLRAVQQQPRKFKVYEKAGTLRVSVQDVKTLSAAKQALEAALVVPA